MLFIQFSWTGKEKGLYHCFFSVLPNVIFEIVRFCFDLIHSVLDNRHGVFPVDHGCVSNGVRSSTASHLVSLRDGLMEHHNQSLLQALLSSLRGTVHRGY